MQNQTQDLLRRYLAGNCTEEEIALVENSYLSYQAPASPLTEAEIARDVALIHSHLARTRKSAKYTLLQEIAAVAAVLLVLISITFYLIDKGDKNNDASLAQDDQRILPGKDQAILTLADGRKIVLDTKASTLLEDDQTGIRIKKTASGALVYEVLASHPSSAQPPGYNMIQTPRGSQYQVILPDGTHIWLNAGSFLKYPIAFIGPKRVVELSGEGYFEVAKNPDMPFIVHTAGQQVEVLGTHFNISAYADGEPIKTTLLEGKVKVSQGREQLLMKPNQQISNSGQRLTLANFPDAAETIAWKDGLFLFNHEELHSIMTKISRWYDVEVEYKDDLKGQFYSGTITKFASVNDVLRIMELTKSVRFRIQGRRIIVMK